jgi:hypothetical protein
MNDEKAILLAQAQVAKNRYQLLLATAAEKRNEAKLAKKEADECLALHLAAMDRLAELDAKN